MSRSSAIAAILLFTAVMLVVLQFSDQLEASLDASEANDVREETSSGDVDAASVTKATKSSATTTSEQPVAGDKPDTGDEIEDWIAELLEEARGGDSEAIVRVIFGLTNVRSPIYEYMQERTSVEEMIQLLRAQIASGNEQALIDAAGLLYAQGDMPELQLPGLYAADVEYGLRVAGQEGNNQATFMLGLLKHQDFMQTGNEQARQQALALYENLGKTGDPEALAALAFLHAGKERFGVERDTEKLRRYLEEFEKVADADQASSLGSSLLSDTHRPDPPKTEFEMGIRLLARAGRSGDDSALNDAAWMLATCKGPQPEQFDQAEIYIRDHIERYGADPASMDTLAAVEARQGDFGSAITAQLEAIRLLEAQGAPPDSSAYQQFYERLNQYQRGQRVSGDDYCPE